MVHQFRSLGQQIDDVTVNLLHRTATIHELTTGTHIGGHIRNRSVCSYQEEISKSFLEVALAEGIVLVILIHVAHGRDIAHSNVSIINQIVRTLPHLVQSRLCLEVTGTQSTKQPVRTGNIVGVEFQYFRELTPTEHIVKPVAINTCHPSINSHL